MVDEVQIKSLLKAFPAPGVKAPLAQLASSLKITAVHPLSISIRLSYPAQPYLPDWIAALQQHLCEQLILETTPDIDVACDILGRAFSFNGKRHKNIRNVIAIASGKGGVGKSTVAVNLARALTALGGRVGLLDVDVYGPSVPHLLGRSAPATSKENHELIPMIVDDIEVISLGQLVALQDPIMWRGPMAAKVVQQMFYNSSWGELDYLIVDLPPGTGDIQMTLGQKLPVTAAVIVTTPQTVACLDAQKAVACFVRMKLPILGFVNNMSIYHCEQCQHPQEIFAGSSSQALAGLLGVEQLCQLPLSQGIARGNESGTSIFSQPDMQAYADIFLDLAISISTRLCSFKKDYSLLMPDVEVQQ